jgi:hypothetical protein
MTTRCRFHDKHGDRRNREHSICHNIDCDFLRRTESCRCWRALDPRRHPEACRACCSCRHSCAGSRLATLMPSGEEVAHALIDVSINAAECRPSRPVAEVVRPTGQISVQRSRTSGHGSLLPGTSRLLTFVLSHCMLFSWTARAQVLLAVGFATVWPKRVAEEVETIRLTHPHIATKGRRQLLAGSVTRFQAPT